MTLSSDLIFKYLPMMTTIEFPSLHSSTGGYLSIGACTNLTTILMPLLKTVKDELEFHAMGKLIRFSLPIVEKVAKFTLYETGLAEINLDSLLEYSDRILITNNPELQRLSISGLKRNGPSFSVNRNRRLSNFSLSCSPLEDMRQAPSHFTICGNSALQAVSSCYLGFVDVFKGVCST
jgi:hypothetical protein